MVLTLLIPMRSIYGLQDMITLRHLENMAKVMLVTGLIVFYGYMMEAFFGWYSANEFEKFMIYNRTTGPYWYMYWTLIFCNGLVPQLLWIKKIRLNVGILFLISIIVNIGMWLERYVIIVTSLHRDFLPSSWGMYQGSRYDWSFYIGTMGLFLTLFYLFVRVLPMIAIFEMRMLLPGGAHANRRTRAQLAPAGRPWLTTPLYGLMAEFTSTDALVSAAERVHQEGYTRIDALTPMPMHGLAEAMGYDDRRIQKMILAGGLARLPCRPRAAAPRQPDRLEPQHRRRLPDRLSAEHRRPAAREPAVVHRPGLRDRRFCSRR